MSNHILRAQIESMLDLRNLEGICTLYQTNRSVLRILISMTYDKKSLRSWRAMEAVGKLASCMDAGEARAVMQRLLWMMREESGTNPWSAAEIIGEILCLNPNPFKDILSVLMHFHDEPMLRPGVLWSIYKIGSLHPELTAPHRDIASGYLNSSDPQVRGLSLLALSTSGGIPADIMDRLSGDVGEFYYYDGMSMKKTRICDLVKILLVN